MLIKLQNFSKTSSKNNSETNEEEILTEKKYNIKNNIKKYNIYIYIYIYMYMYIYTSMCIYKGGTF